MITSNTRAYIFKCVKNLNITNLPQWSVYLSREDLYDPCIPVAFAETGTFGIKVAEFPTLVCPNDPESSFRDAVWPDKIGIVDKILSDNPDKKLVFGVHHTHQVEFLKDHFQERAFVLGSSYDDEETYDLLLTYFAQAHVYQQSLGIMPITEHDLELRKIHKTSLVPVYKKIFNELNIVPRAIDHSGDYVIPLKDFFNLEKYTQHMNNAGLPLGQKAIDYYNAWNTTLIEWNKL